MDKESNIIAIRKRDISFAHEAFVDLMGKTEKILNEEALLRPDEYKKLTSSTLESCAVEKIKKACTNSPFDANEVVLVSGQRFPDIVANNIMALRLNPQKRIIGPQQEAV